MLYAQPAENGQPGEENTGNHFFEKKQENNPVLNKRDIPDSYLRELKDQDAFWYADKISKKDSKIREQQAAEPYVPISKRTWFQTLLWLLILGGFAGVITWFLAENRVGLFNKKSRETGVTSEDISEDIFAINYQKEIDKALQQGNYRLGVRLMFLRLLKNMAEKDIINYKQDKTNLDYLLELHPTAYYNNFFRVARNYEYSWYGQFDVNRDAYGIIKKDFDQLERLLYKL